MMASQKYHIAENSIVCFIFSFIFLYKAMMVQEMIKFQGP